jgi:hypothetical protein
MTRKSRSAALLAAVASFGLATGTAFAANGVRPPAQHPQSAAASGYVYPNFWGEDVSEPPSSATTAHQGDGSGSKNISLFPPNPNW